MNPSLCLMKLLFSKSVPCRFNPYTCTSKLKIDQYKLEIQYVDKVFHGTFRKFLTAIDHIDYHPSQIQNTTRKKRSEEYAVHGHYQSYTRTLNPSEEIFLDNFLIAMQEINTSLHQDLSRMKTFGILIWILGWGVFPPMPRASERSKKICIPSKGKTNYNTNKSSTWLSI